MNAAHKAWDTRRQLAAAKAALMANAAPVLVPANSPLAKIASVGRTGRQQALTVSAPTARAPDQGRTTLRSLSKSGSPRSSAAF